MDEQATAVPIAADTGRVLALGAELLDRGGIAIWAIAALSVVSLAIILWKVSQFAAMGAWRRAGAEAAVDAWRRGNRDEAAALSERASGSCARVVGAAVRALSDARMSEEDARAETARIAKRHIGQAQSGLRGLELIATVAPLLGLLGTVLGMIAAFQALETAGSQADPSALAGGIWEALLTTAAGMAVAIPASMALSWFDSINDRLAHDFDDLATQVLTHRKHRDA